MTRPEAARDAGIVDVLRLKISQGEYPEGSKLPGETALAEQLQASRSTVRRAVVELGREGLVSAARGRGTFVRIRPEKRLVQIGAPDAHEDLLAAAYEPARRGWIHVWPARRSAPQHARIVGCGAERANILGGVGLKQPIILREQRWRHQENGYVIALTSFAPISLFAKLANPLEPESDGRPDSEREIDVYRSLTAEHGPVTFSVSVNARMPTVREREDLEMEVGVPLLLVTRTMLDEAGRPLEATVLHAPADRFEVAQAGRKPILTL